MATQTDTPTPRYISLRWRVLLPLFTVLCMVIVPAAYVLVMAADSPTTPAAQQITALFAATGAGLALVVAFVGLAAITRRVNRVTQTAERLAAGHATSRTNMQPKDEIGRMGQALDQYADYVQERQDTLRAALRRQRRETAHLLSVLEALPDGVIVQNTSGKVILINDHARRLLGAERVNREDDLRDVTAVVTDALGPAVAPGLYALGAPHRLSVDGRVLQANAVAVMSMANYRLGTVTLLRDITEQARQERRREQMLNQMQQDIEEPLDQLAQKRGGMMTDLMVSDFARQVKRHAVALHKSIVDLRDMEEGDTTLQQAQQPISVEMLVWAIANEWRQNAQINNLTMEITIGEKGLAVLGDERRLRWAIGNLVDNAIKYTPPGGTLTLEVTGSHDDRVQFRIRDNGVGIDEDELPYIFTRFYRGTPRLQDGNVIRVPGMGQGLHIARKIIESHGGAIRVKSKVGVGTAVYFALPLTADVSLQLPYLTETDIDGETVKIDRNSDMYRDLDFNA